jgi:hypothetical protein
MGAGRLAWTIVVLEAAGNTPEMLLEFSAVPPRPAPSPGHSFVAVRAVRAEQVILPAPDTKVALSLSQRHRWSDVDLDAGLLTIAHSDPRSTWPSRPEGHQIHAERVLAPRPGPVTTWRGHLFDLPPASCGSTGPRPGWRRTLRSERPPQLIRS